MSTWQAHPLDDKPVQAMHLGELYELAQDEEETAISSTGQRVHPDGYVEYQCDECGDWCLRNVEEPCAQFVVCLPCYLDGEDPAVLLPESDVDATTIPPAVPWTELVEYRCGSCNSWCLNWSGLDCTRFKECRDCHRVPDLSQAPPLSASEGKGAEGTSAPGSSRPEGATERPEGAPEATVAERGLAPDRAARAHPRRPKGEGERERSAVTGPYWFLDRQ